MNTLRIGIVGVGRMGANIARRLKDVGSAPAAIYDADTERALRLSHELTVRVFGRLRGVTENSDVIITVVSDDAAMETIFSASPKDDSLLHGAKGKIFVNCATVSPRVHVQVDALCRARGAAAVEACMASSITQAREGALYLMCGGDEAAFERVRPLLQKLSSSLRFVGGPGKAAEVKALVNMLMNINTAGLAEALALGQALDLDLAMVREIFSQTGAASRVLETDGADMQAREHEVYFSAAHAAKDSGIALELAREAGLDLPLATATKAQYDAMVAHGLGELDKSGIAELTFKDRRPR
ncbi:MAG: NAD(P)-dependent oxidoreductase [Candidatus Velthaea sp.]|jgi:3-hydroxyisobutyrate dehydrogenase